jgi:hypothetical protein
LSVAATFHLVLVTWIFFRSETFQKSWLMLTQLGTLTSYHPNLHPKILAILAVGLISHWLPERWYQASQQAFIRMPAPAQGVVLFCAALVLREMASAEATPFIYFQF